MPPKKACLATIGATGVVLASLVAGPAFAAPAPTAGTATAAATAEEGRVAVPVLTATQVSSGLLVVDVQGTPNSMVDFTYDDGQNRRVLLDESGHNTIQLGIANGRAYTFQMTATLFDDENRVVDRVDFEWSVDPREVAPPTDDSPADPGAGLVTYDVTSIGHDYAQVVLTGPAGKSYGVVDAHGRWAGSGVFSSAGTDNISLYVPAGVVTRYTLELRENYEVVDKADIVIDRTAGDPVTPTPEVPVEPELPVEPETPVEPEQPGTPGDARASFEITSVGQGYAQVALTGPAGANWGVSDADGRWAGGGRFGASGTDRVSLSAPAGEQTSYTLALREDYTVVESHEIVIDRVGDVEQPPVVPVTPTPGEVVVGEIRDGVASVSITGPFFGAYLVHDAAGDCVAGGRFEGYRSTIRVPAPAGVVSTYQLTMIGVDGPVEFSVDAR
ncbi:hypothetical protein ASF17_07455 [Frigoribacterium sp. Leaf263]|uniref:hypothetical protein n=1 Tax=Frigoribacterium sp. Leaf263 TaxID=1736313 RepID=UPI0006FDC0D9|nr:hypothetical protein [Frigoribacterium sp. Leaf263]KQO82831.1 hypothetical protein ASF17_07455 [Frigoribacterium sp. Leaf263]